MDSTTILGYTASAVTVFTFLPQVVKTWKEKSAKNVSLLMFIIAIANEILWIAYGVQRDDMVIILTNIVMMCMASIMIYLKIRYKNA
ncbi:MAG TPA: SemiSWEET transporter [Chitinophagaceae bacterium]|jgi:MtN3 and saliva related transmembrane protein|nr:SemiSWEET transporter [Chitinophagaceae bacterium]